MSAFDPHPMAREWHRLLSLWRADEADDWIELAAPDMIRLHAAQIAAEAGRPSCRRPARDYARASRLYTEHMRRTGDRDSLRRAFQAAEDAADAARNRQERTMALHAEVSAHLTEAELWGGEQPLHVAEQRLCAAPAPGLWGARMVALHARLKGFACRAGNDLSLIRAGAALMDAALHALERHRAPALEVSSLRMERAALMLEVGLRHSDTAMLDQSGRDLRRIIGAHDPDLHPLTRGRALALLGIGLARLAALGQDAGLLERARQLVATASDHFHAEHSPLDFAAMQIAIHSVRDPEDMVADTDGLAVAERLTLGRGLLLGAAVLEARARLGIARAMGDGDSEALDRVLHRLRRKLALTRGADQGLEWAALQIALARTTLARNELVGAGAELTPLAEALWEAEAIAGEHANAALASEARAMREVIMETAGT
jgi:hypothetical protein